jgi:hypothetical protein
MNYGPLEFAAYLNRKKGKRKDSATVEAARAAAPAREPANRLTVISGPRNLPRLARAAQVEAVSVYEAVAMNAPCTTRAEGPVRVHVRATPRSVVLVLSSHQAVEWQITLAPDASLAAVLLSGYGHSTVAGAGLTPISSIGGFYAFKRGSAEFIHLEHEVLRCTGRSIDNFQSMYAGSAFEIGTD